ncbi:hypothetical protein IJ102_00490 [Candidatus Saccharibacteria bacterium]|nr:hypothetical protein [Candidatus Saccharibacteria bacterium]
MSVNNAVLSGGADNGAAKPKITSPNIKSVADERLDKRPDAESPRKASETAKIDGVPIADEHVKFRARDIRPFNLGKLFVKVEGSEERRRAIQRELHQQRKESIKVQKASERSKRQKARRAARQSRRDKIDATFWRGKRKFITISILLLVIIIAVTAPLLIEHVIKPALDRYHFDATEQAKTQATNRAADHYQTALDHLEEQEYSEEALAKVSQDFRNHLASASDIEKVYLATSFAQIVYDATGSANLAIDILLEFPPAESVSDWVKIEYYAPLGGYYERIGDEEKVAEYNNVIDGLMPRLEARPVERKSDDGSSGQDFSEEEQ